MLFICYSFAIHLLFICYSFAIHKHASKQRNPATKQASKQNQQQRPTTRPTTRHDETRQRRRRIPLSDRPRTREGRYSRECSGTSRCGSGNPNSNIYVYQSEGGAFRTAYSIPGRGNGAAWGQILLLLLLLRRASGRSLHNLNKEGPEAATHP